MTQTVLDGNTSEAYTYDAVDNRLSGPSGGTYSYNNSNELTSLGSVTYAYDNNGNLTSKSNSNPAWTVTYTWDFENRLTSVSGGTGGTFNFKYDPFGRRIYISSSNGTIIYAYDGDSIIDQMDQTGTWQSRFTHGLGIDEPLEIRQQSVPLYYHADGLGSIVAVTNASRAVAASYTYNSFGTWSVQTQIVTSPYGFTGREFDNANGALPGPGLYYYRARYYDPSIGRFLSEDPAFSGLNFYAYATNTPCTDVDPFGEVQCRKTAHGATVCSGGSLDRAHANDIIDNALRRENLCRCLNKYFGPGVTLTKNNAPRINYLQPLPGAAAGQTIPTQVPDKGIPLVNIDPSIFNLPANDTFLTDTYLHETANALAIQQFTNVFPRGARPFRGARGGAPTAAQRHGGNVGTDPDIGEQFEECLHGLN